MSGGRGWGSVIGAVVGYFVPGLGWAAGAALGGAVGGLFEPKQRTESGRVDDLRVSMSQYGAGIPETWGNNAPPTTWVWSTDIIELGETQEAGKGGGAEHTTYRQFLHGYLVLGKTPPVGSTVTVRKMWVDGKLVYDGSSGLSVAQALATEENPYTQLSIHPGFEDQIPHPIMEFYEGIGNTPAYRGVVGMFIFGLECPGGRVPQISAELCVNAATVQEKKEIVRVPDSRAANAWDDTYAVIRSGDEVWHVTETGPGSTLDVWRIGPGYSTSIRRIVTQGSPVISTVKPVSGNGPPSVIRARFASGSYFDPLYIERANLETGAWQTVLSYTPESGANSLLTGSSASASFCEETGLFVARGGGSNWDSRLAIWETGATAYRVSDAVPGTPGPVFVDELGAYCLVADSTDGGKLKVILINPSTGAVSGALVGPAMSSLQMNWAGLHCDDIACYGWVRSNSTGKAVVIKFGRDGTTTILSNDAETTVGQKIGNRATTFFANDKHVTIGPSTVVEGGHAYTMIRMGVLSPTRAPLSKIIKAQCDRVGLAGKIDVTPITESIWGATFNKSPDSARSVIAPLLTFAGAVQVEEDGLIKFKHRADQVPVATIAYDELGCVEEGQEPEDPFPLTRTQEAECPAAVTVEYNDPGFDYQKSTQTARRIVTDSQLEETVALDLAILPGEAATIAHRILYERWISRNTRSFKVSRKFAFLSPADVVTIEYPRGTTGNYMLAKVTDTGALIEGECVEADAELLAQTVPGSGGVGQQIAPLVSPTQLTVVDSAILRDADNNAGVYAAMAGFDAAWAGSVLWAGEDDGSLQQRGTVTQVAAQGPCESTLANYTLGNVDEHNLLTVNVGAGSLASITRDVLLNGTSNVAAVGQPGRWEIVKFQRADSLGSGRFLLSGLLRGLQGTEWAAGQHQTSDRFVLLSGGGVLRPVYDGGSIGASKAYRAVSIGRRFDSVSTQYSTNTGEALRPLSPTTLRKSFAANDIVLSWARRSRLSNQWWLGNVPLGEEAERYEVDVFADATFATVKRTLTSSSPAVTYTSAQQVADFGANQSTVHLRIYQVSGTVGRGHELQMSI